MTPENKTANANRWDSTRAATPDNTAGENTMSDDQKPERLSNYARYSTAELHRKAESHRAMLAAIEHEIQRRQDSGESDDEAIARFHVERAARRQAARDWTNDDH